MATIFAWLVSFAASKVPWRSPAFYVNAVSAVAAVLYATGLWQFAPKVAANFFAVVVCVNLAFDLGRHWIEQLVGRLGE